MKRVFAFFVLTLATGGLAAQKPIVVEAKNRFSYLDNGQVKVGVDLMAGGAITYLSLSGHDDNVLDSREWGRQVQATYLGGPVPYSTNGKKAPAKLSQSGWNPAQIGDHLNNPSALLEHHNDGKSLRVKCRPLQWALDREPAECTIETTIVLDGLAARVKHRLENHRTDRALHPAREQQWPVVNIRPSLLRLKAYTGDRPFTGGSVSTIVRSGLLMEQPWINFSATESWAALMDDGDFGVGLCLLGRTRYRGASGVDKVRPGLLTAFRTETFDREIVFDHEYALIVGELDAIRATALRLTPKPMPPVWEFTKDRQGWHARGANEGQWPFDGEWKLSPTGPKQQVIEGPDIFWLAEQAPILTLEAAFKTQHPQVKAAWLPLDASDFSLANSMTLDVIPDGTMRTYTLDLSTVEGYRGAMTRLRIDTTPLGRPGDEVRIRRITLGPKLN